MLGHHGVSVAAISSLATSSTFIAIGQATETDSAFAFAKAHSLDIGLSIETDTGLTTVPRRTAVADMAAESDTAFAAAALHSIIVALATEIDEGLQFTASGAVSIDAGQEVDTAAAMSVAKVLSILIALETDTALPLTTESVTATIALLRGGASTGAALAAMFSSYAALHGGQLTQTKGALPAGASIIAALRGSRH